MNSLRISGSISLNGEGVGTAGHPDNAAPIQTKLTASLSSAGSAGTLANKVLYYDDRTLAGLSSETFDLTSFSSALEESGTALTKVRIYAVVHSSSSAATTGIRVGNAATPFPGQLNTAATTRTLTPGAGFIELNPTTAGIGVTAGMSVKIENLDASTATYSICVSGE